MGLELSGTISLEEDLKGSMNIPVLKGNKGDKGDPGIDGHSPVVTATKSGGVVSIMVDGTEIATVADGSDGHSPVVTASKSDGVTTISVDGTAIATVNDGIDGQNGQDGHSPVVTASKSGKTTTVSIDGTPVATITDGSDGQDGADGHSPAVTASKSGKVTTISVDGTPIATITDGQDGHSPTITATKSGKVVSISIDGSVVATVSDGIDGSDGQDGHSPVITGSKSGTVTTISADGTPIATINDGDDYVLTESDKADIAALVDVPVSDVTINGTSVVSDGVAEIPIATYGMLGVVSTNADYGVTASTGGRLYIALATEEQIKNGTGQYRPVTPNRQDQSAFYGLAKAAGDTTQSSSSNAVGTYTDTAKAAIKNMLGVSGESQTITVSGTTPTITAQPNTRYICGEVLSLDFTPCTSGICNVTFTSGSTVTVLNLPQTVKMPEWFEVETNTTYEISIMDGVYGAVMSWGA